MLWKHNVLSPDKLAFGGIFLETSVVSGIISRRKAKPMLTLFSLLVSIYIHLFGDMPIVERC